MKNRKKKEKTANKRVAPGIDPEDSYGEKATQTEIKKGEYTTVTRLVYDEYDASKD